MTGLQADVSDGVPCGRCERRAGPGSRRPRRTFRGVYDPEAGDSALIHQAIPGGGHSTASRLTGAIRYQVERFHHWRGRSGERQFTEGSIAALSRSRRGYPLLRVAH